MTPKKIRINEKGYEEYNAKYNLKKFFISHSFSSPHRDEIVEVRAPNEIAARLYANNNVEDWANCYTKETIEFDYFPKGITSIVEVDNNGKICSNS